MESKQGAQAIGGKEGFVVRLDVALQSAGSQEQINASEDGGGGKSG